MRFDQFQTFFLLLQKKNLARPQKSFVFVATEKKSSWVENFYNLFDVFNQDKSGIWATNGATMIR